MDRAVAFLVTLLLAVTPTVDVMCRAFCTPGHQAAPSCHDLAAPGRDGSLSSTSCERNVAPAIQPADTTRNLVPPAPLLPIQFFEEDCQPVLPAGDVVRQAARARHSRPFVSTIVLRI